jgi:aquaporin Z
MNANVRKYLVELIGTAVLVLVGCGAVVLGGYGAALPLGVVPIGLAFGLAVMAMAYAIGPVSGCHINPAVTIAMWAAGRMETNQAIAYIISQLVGGVVGALVLWIIVQGKAAGYDVAAAGLGQNGWGPDYLGGYGVGSAIIVELVATFIFTAVILGIGSERGGRPAGLLIGLTLFALHLPFLMVTGLSVNPARSLGPAVFAGTAAISQLWLFIIVPAIAGAITGWLYRAKILSAE